MDNMTRKLLTKALQDDKSWKGYVESNKCDYIRFDANCRAIRGSKNQFISNELREAYGELIEEYWIIRGGLGRVIGVVTPMHDLYYKLTSWAAEEVAIQEAFKSTRRRG